MISIDWHQLEKNSESSPQEFFESFNYQIAVKKFGTYGNFSYFYNTPGSEFYLTLTKDCNELSAQSGDIIGWQVKYWFNNTDPDNSPLGSQHRAELIEGFKKSLEYKPGIKTWIVCTPGLFSNTAPHYPVNSLERDIKHVKLDINILYWQKPNYEAIYHENPDCYASIFNHYFSQHYLSFEIFKRHSLNRLSILRKKYDTDLYTPGKIDRNILSSINYENLVPALLDKIKHILEERDKYKNSYLREQIKKFLETTDKEITDRDKKFVSNLNTFIEFLLLVISKLSVYSEEEKTLAFLKELLNLIKEDSNKIIELMDTTNLTFDGDNEIQIDYELEIQGIHHLINSLRMTSELFFKKLVKIYRLLFKITRQIYHVFGEAGFGKTNLSCFLTEHLLSNGYPVLLIPASEISASGGKIENQILSFIGIDSQLSFKEFLGILDIMGSRQQTKITIIIDGLNETQPSASVWHPQLHYIINDINAFSNLILITTCRNAYINQIFQEDNIDNIAGSIKIEGFKENIEEAITKYFQKYNITAKNIEFDRNLFRSPLFLRIFSIVNENKTIEINETNIYDSINEYVETIINKVSSQDGIINPIFRSQTSKGFRDYCKDLWNSNSRGLYYPGKLAVYLDPDYTTEPWHETKSYKIIDEGLIFRNLHDSQEYAEFTHDLIGGFCIAKRVIFEEKKYEEVIQMLRSDEVKEKLTSSVTSEKHPLAEDILRAIVYLCPTYTHKEIFEITDNQDFLISTLSMLRMVFSRKGGKESFVKRFKDIEQNNPIVPHIFDNSITQILDSKDLWMLLDLFISIISRMEMYQIDLAWSEAIRRKQDVILPYLHKEIETHEKGERNSENLIQRLLFISLLLSSTSKYMRDKATKTLVTIGEIYPNELFEVLLILEKIKDLYIKERLMASIIGALMRAENKEILFKVCKHLEDNYFINVNTTHVQILDYIDTLLSYSSKHYGFKRVSEYPSSEDLITWEKDIECMGKVADYESALWGFGPVDYDFAKYEIQPYVSRRGNYDDNEKLPSLIESLAMIVWRAKELGYSEGRFKLIDTQISNDRYKFDTHSLQTYAEKYSLIAFKELYGYNIIRGYSLNFNDSKGFRVPVSDIDPTFPRLPRKRQLITCCFTPTKTETVQEWINKDAGSFLESHYARDDLESKGQKWIMLYGQLRQQTLEKSHINIDVFTYLIPENSQAILDKFKTQKFATNYFSIDHHYLFAGEIPWSPNVIDDVIWEEMNGRKIRITLPVSSYFRESQSEFEIKGNAYFVSKIISEELNLRINLNDFNLYTISNERASTYIYDSYSKFLYMRANLLNEYLNKTQQKLVWIEAGSKYGYFGHDLKKKYDPPFKDYFYLKML